MNYRWAKDYVLQLINQYSIAGSVTPESYNNQADYLDRIPKLLNDAQIYVATTVGKIRKVVPLSELESVDNGKWVVYTMPEDFWQLCSGGLIRYDDDNELERCNLYHAIGANQIAVSKSVSGNMSAEYYRLPQTLTDEPLEEEELDNTVPAQMALPYYVAAHLVMYDNAYAYQALMNEFETRLARLAESPTIIYGTVADTYGAAEDWGGY